MRLIDADALIKEITDLKESPWFNTGKESHPDAWFYGPHLSFLARKEAVETVVELCINEAPTIEPDRPHGEWVEKSKFDRLCKNCGQQHIGDKRFANFCPNCGARMKEGDEK